MTTTRQVVKVEREKLETCMTCPLCNKLFRDATTISECLHTFCRKCIYRKITDEEFDNCPVCNIDLGCSPLEKLRADHSLEDLKTKFFPSKRQKAKAPAVMPLVPEPVPSVLLPARRKEISLSSLVVSTPKVSSKSVLPRKRLKAIARKNPALRESILIEESIKKLDRLHESLSSPETITKIAQSIRQNSSPDSSKQHKKEKDAEDSAEPCESKADLWKPLNFLVEVANKSKLTKLNPQDTLVQMQLPDPAENEPDEVVKNNDDHGNRSKANGNANELVPSPSKSSVKTRKSQGLRQRRAAELEGSTVPAKAVTDASSKCCGEFSPIWFSLIASNDQKVDAPLPQITSCYLRVKDGSLPVSFIKKYLVQKLGLNSEAEVEIGLQGKPVVSTLPLQNIVDWWLKMAPTSERIQTTVGSSAKDFVMVLSYGRKAQPP
ncbi:E3 ubiquitin protein ligase DRIP2 [Ricinus communis]|uniref:Ring finger protein, putative n=1 Tax=Ricinus communis TaxID=3988 RepID=B9RTF1_RICCO|nr:E3 ubiquitin protein ligase DRIP2 [Ricinus communis]EEF45183.1 ring finger protein, putative [Ricinus communis]|eukprot:XP_002517020.1 E3 ubiquitin protein ligase DRIP2 [Ricinus communis]